MNIVFFGNIRVTFRVTKPKKKEYQGYFQGYKTRYKTCPSFSTKKALKKWVFGGFF